MSHPVEDVSKLVQGIKDATAAMADHAETAGLSSVVADELRAEILWRVEALAAVAKAGVLSVKWDDTSA